MVSKEMGEKLKNDFGFYLFMEVSVKTGFNPQEIFIQAALLLYNDYNDYNNNNNNNKQEDGLKLVNIKLKKYISL